MLVLVQAIIPVKGGAARLSVGVQPYHTRQALEMDNGHCGVEFSGGVSQFLIFRTRGGGGAVRKFQFFSDKGEGLGLF